MFDRLELLIGKDIEKLKKANILLIGLGGVGGYVFECLIRSGIENITVIDFDKFDITNLNRQILATKETINMKKTEIALKRALLINSNCHIKTIDVALKEDNIKELINDSYDYIIDACDDVKTKISLIKYAKDHNLKLISCMGTANKKNPLLFKITNLDKTCNDPLAKKIRTSLPKKYLNTKVLWSSEVPLIKRNLGTFCAIPMTAGAIIAQYVINEFLKNNENHFR